MLFMLRKHHLQNKKIQMSLKKEIGFHPKGHLKNMKTSIFTPSGYRWYCAVVRSRSQLMALVTKPSLRE